MNFKSTPEQRAARKIRYGVTCIANDGERKLAAPFAQARFLWDEREEAEKWLRACLSDEDNVKRLRSIHGEGSTGTFRVDPFECYDHGDPKGHYPKED